MCIGSYTKNGLVPCYAEVKKHINTISIFKSLLFKPFFKYVCYFVTVAGKGILLYCKYATRSGKPSTSEIVLHDIFG